jgi:hypothetical protein
MTLADQIMHRRELEQAIRDTYSPDSFPGSKKWSRNQAAINTLEAYDAQYPEVVTEVTRRRNIQSGITAAAISPVTGGDL